MPSLVNLIVLQQLPVIWCEGEGVVLVMSCFFLVSAKLGGSSKDDGVAVTTDTLQVSLLCPVSVRVLTSRTVGACVNKSYSVCVCVLTSRAVGVC